MVAESVAAEQDRKEAAEGTAEGDKVVVGGVADEADGDRSFDELGLDSRLISALLKKGVDKPTPINPGKDVVARAKTGSGKTFSYLLLVLQKLFGESGSTSRDGLHVLVLVPTRELCQQATRESRAQDLRNEILNSEKLKAHFEANPRDLDLLKHDTVLSKKAPAPHLRNVPDYLIDQKTKEDRNMVKLTQAAIGNINTNHKQGFKWKSRKSRDPLKTFKGEAQRKRKQEGALNNKVKKRRSHE